MKSIKYKSRNFKKIKIKTYGTKTTKPQINLYIDDILFTILKIILLIFFISIDILIINSNLVSNNKANNKLSEITSYVDSHNITLEEIMVFRKINEDNKYLEENQKFIKSDNPILTIIITVYNQAHCIHKCIKSIQNQSIKNLEILIIDDCSTDNTTDIIQLHQQQDPRIILYSHDRNEGPIKTRSEGVRKAKGEYITIIDGDDAFTYKDILKNSLYIAQKGNLDVVEFQAGYFKNKEFKVVVNDYLMINLTNIIYQPELRTQFLVISDDEEIRAVQSRSIWAKIIRNEVFQKVLQFIGPKYTEDFISKYEDTIMAFSLYQIAQSYYYMKILGYYYSRDEFKGHFPKLPNKICKPNNAEIKDMGHIKLMHFLYEKTDNNESDRQLVYHEIISIHHYLSLIIFTNHHYEFVYDILDKMINCSFLSDRQKQRLISIKTGIEEKQNKK